ncbi:flavin reductase family protein [Tunicatimonas pelagia]|uniref:flavin reductase family protein n=1 Tax=Tunicatimonas pelagia TaxID=931531 RepID=UPI0026653F95|nr:flavin reductase family protein [Tunicatimonas pelagia]WKN41503.1 flavin reductase family protein [Tunicatimonas pelagia]
MKEQEVSQALKKITYGFYIVTTRKPSEEMSTRDKDYVAAATVSWVSQASFNPPMVTIAVQKHTDLHETIEKSRVFAVNIVGKNEQDMLKPFSEKSIIEEDTINGFSFKDGKTGSPVLQDVPAYFECKVIDDLSDGDHSVYLGEVVGGETLDTDAVPLVEWETDMHYGG